MAQTKDRSGYRDNQDSSTERASHGQSVLKFFTGIGQKADVPQTTASGAFRDLTTSSNVCFAPEAVVVSTLVGKA
jgi:hypothetical protein